MASPDELGAWMALYGPALQRFFARKIGQADADDLVQEVFLRLQAQADRAPAENVERFLFTVAKRVLIDRYRFNAAHGAGLRELFDATDFQADELSPERIVAAKQDFARVIQAVVNLPPRMRTAFVLHKFHRLGYSAIAKRMKISKGSVQGLMQRAFERLARELGDLP